MPVIIAWRRCGWACGEGCGSVPQIQTETLPATGDIGVPVQVEYRPDPENKYGTFLGESGIVAAPPAQARATHVGKSLIAP